MTTLNLDAIEAQARAALELASKGTSGEWCQEWIQDGECLPDGTGYAGDWEETEAITLNGIERRIGEMYDDDDRKFVVASRTGWPESAQAVLDLAALARSQQARIADLEHQRNELGKAIAEAALDAGIYNGSVSLTGPDLLLLARDLADEITVLRHEAKLRRLREERSSRDAGANVGALLAKVPPEAWEGLERIREARKDTTVPVEQRGEGHCHIPTNVFYVPGGVEPEKWRSR